MTLGRVIALLTQQWMRPRLDRVVEGYRALGNQHEVTLADIALRNHVFTPADAADLYAAGVAEGRRRCALEIFQLASVKADTLYTLIEQHLQRPTGART